MPNIQNIQNYIDILNQEITSLDTLFETHKLMERRNKLVFRSKKKQLDSIQTLKDWYKEKQPTYDFVNQKKLLADLYAYYNSKKDLLKKFQERLETERQQVQQNVPASEISAVVQQQAQEQQVQQEQLAQVQQDAPASEISEVVPQPEQNQQVQGQQNVPASASNAVVQQAQGQQGQPVQPTAARPVVANVPAGYRAIAGGFGFFAGGIIGAAGGLIAQEYAKDAFLSIIAHIGLNSHPGRAIALLAVVVGVIYGTYKACSINNEAPQIANH